MVAKSSILLFLRTEMDLVDPPPVVAHLYFFGYLSKYFHLPIFFCGTESAGTYLYQSPEEHSDRYTTDIVFLRPRVCLAVRGKAPSARLEPAREGMVGTEGIRIHLI